MPRRSRRRRPRWRRALDDVGLTIYVTLFLLLSPVLLVLLFVALPFWTLAERRRRCPNCGLRGTLRDVTPPPPPLPEDEEFWSIRRRIAGTRRWRCELCEAEFQEWGDRLVRHVPTAPPEAPA